MTIAALALSPGTGRRLSRFCLATTLLATLPSLCPWFAVLVEASQAQERPPVFESDIRPVLTRKCGKCHSDQVRKGGLDLSSMQGLRRGGESGDAAVAASVDDSLLWIMIEGGDMPPDGQPPLTSAELALVRRWIAAGARRKNLGNRQNST